MAVINNSLGIDIQLTDDGDLFVDGSGELVWVTSAACLQQSLPLRLLCQYGQYVFNIDYGSDLPSLAGPALTPAQKQLIQAAVTSSLLADYRVQSVVQVTVTADSKHTYINAVIVDIANNTLTLGSVSI